MPDESIPLTLGVDHVGLTVASLDAARSFFCDCLGWRVVGEKPAYPAIFVSDGKTMVTLWQAENPQQSVAFDRRKNIGLHHLALKVATRAALDDLHLEVSAWEGVVVEFAPQLSGPGPRVHFIVREPGGTRIEFVFDPR